MALFENLSLLLVEDSPVDAEAIARALKQASIGARTYHCEDGDEALDFLLDEDANKPDIVLLDLNLPGTGGREVLSTIKKTPYLCHIPVIIFSTSDHEQDIKHCYASGANSYVQKPVNPTQFQRIILDIANYWFSSTILPRRDPT